MIINDPHSQEEAEEQYLLMQLSRIGNRPVKKMHDNVRSGNKICKDSYDKQYRQYLTR